MADDIQEPQSTYSGGSAVMSATDAGGAKWSYDNDAGKWVNLTTGDALSPAEFSDHAGRGGNAAQGTMALAQAMRQEEASLMPPTRPAAPQPAQAPTMAAPVAPPQTGTQPMQQAPVMPPGGSPIAPPQIDPAYRQQLMEQRPVPSTVTPPSPASIQNYNFQMYQRAVSQGMPQKQAAQIYLGPMLAAQGSSKAPMPMTEYQREQLRLREEDIKRKEAKASAIKPPKTETPKASVAVNKRYASLVAEETQAKLENDPRKARIARAEREAFEQEHPELGFKTGETATAAPQQSSPAPAPKIQPGAVPKVTNKDEFDALPSGTVYIGSDGKKYKKP